MPCCHSGQTCFRQGPNGTADTLAYGHLLFDPVPGDTGPASAKQISGEFRLLGTAE